MIEKIKVYDGFGLFSPWIFEPSHNNRVGQKTNMMSGVPDPAKNKNGVDKTTKQDASRETLLLNQRFKREIIRSPNNSPINTLGNLMA